MGCCLGAVPNIGSVVVRDSTVQGVMPGSPESLEGRNSIDTCPNGAIDESISIYAKSRCQWNGRLIKKSSNKGNMFV